jgi:hypothetical protein
MTNIGDGQRDGDEADVDSNAIQKEPSKYDLQRLPSLKSKEKPNRNEPFVNKRAASNTKATRGPEDLGSCQTWETWSGKRFSAHALMELMQASIPVTEATRLKVSAKS